MTRVHRLDTNPSVPLPSRTSCQCGTDPTSSACSPGSRLPTCTLCDDAVARTMTRVITASDGTTGRFGSRPSEKSGQ